MVVAITRGSSDWGQFVCRSLRVSCRVIVPLGSSVEIWFKSKANISLVPVGPALLPAVSVP